MKVEEANELATTLVIISWIPLHRRINLVNNAKKYSSIDTMTRIYPVCWPVPDRCKTNFDGVLPPKLLIRRIFDRVSQNYSPNCTVTRIYQVCWLVPERCRTDFWWRIARRMEKSRWRPYPYRKLTSGSQSPQNTCYLLLWMSLDSELLSSFSRQFPTVIRWVNTIIIECIFFYRLLGHCLFDK